MHRLAISILSGFVLLYFQSFLVMKLNGYNTVHFLSVSSFTSIWAVNTFLIYSLFYLKRQRTAAD